MTIIEVLARPLTPFSAHSSPPCRRTISRATCIQSYFSEAQALDVKHRADPARHEVGLLDDTGCQIASGGRP